MTFLRERMRHSAWSANMYLDTPSLWVYRQIFQRWGADSARASMGRAVERRIETALIAEELWPNHIEDLVSLPVEAAWPAIAKWMRFATACWDEITGGLAEPERDFVAPIAWNMLCELAAVEDELGAFRVAQARSGLDDPRLFLDGLSIPCRYTVDLSFDHADVDLKATLRLPSKPHHAHLRQMGLYRRLRGKNQWLLYATPKRSVLFKLESEEDNAALEAAADEAVAAFHAIEALNDTYDNPHDVTRIIPLNSDAWQWTDEELAEAKELWNGS